MKTAIILAQGIKQICFTPETDNEKEALSLITTDDKVDVVIKRGTMYDDEQVLGVDIYECQDGYLRGKESKESVMFVLRPKTKE